MHECIWALPAHARTLHRILLFVAGMLLCVGQVGAQFRILVSEPLLDEFPIVKIPIQVKDNASKIENLALSQFTIRENGVVRTPLYLDCETDTVWESITFLFVLDVSYSMSFQYGSNVEDPQLEKWYAAKSAFSTAIDAMRPGDGGALYSLSRETRKEVDFTTDKNMLQRGLDDMWFLPGTAIYNTIIQVLTDAVAYGGRKVMVLLTDGSDQLSTSTIDDAIGMGKAMNIPIFIIGLDVQARDEPALQRISLETGGDYYYAPTSEQLQIVMNNISESILSKRCILAYQTDDTCRDGRVRNVEISASIPPYQAVVNTSYKLPDELERIPVQIGIPGTRYDDESRYNIPFLAGGRLTRGQPLHIRADIEFDPSILAYRGLVQGGALAFDSNLSVTETAAGHLDVRADDLVLAQTIERNELEALFYLQFDVLYQDRLKDSEFKITGLVIAQDCPSVASEQIAPFSVLGCPEELLVSIDSSVIAFGGREVAVPVLLHNPVDLQQELNYTFTIHYDDELLTYKRIQTAASLSENLTMSVEQPAVGQLRITASGGVPTERSGKLFQMIFDAKTVQDARFVNIYFEYAYMAQTCVPLMKTSGNGIWLDGECNKIVRRRDFYLGQNAPNPVIHSRGSEVVIQYRVEGTASVNLTVYNMNGDPIAELGSGFLAKGSYSATLNTSELSAGTYMYVLREGDKMWTRKMVISK